ncbi:SDR family oxidoreductase [Kitasatospora sp. NPDC051914]|uniref:SDR family oxidoreductase n=1 Tax=Kitasatospora sp. NPDC051914 TaxID=3154945 RepID=UPI00343E2172
MAGTEPGAVPRRLAGRVAVVSGVSGFAGEPGAAVARRLAAEGARVVCADADERAGQAVARSVGGLFVHTDPLDEYMVEALFDEAYETLGGVDVVFNGPSGAPPADGPVLETPPDAWRAVQDTRLTAVFLGCRAALPYLRRHGHGSVVNLAGPAVEGGIAATVAAAGVAALTRELADRFGPEGIRFNALGGADAERLAATTAWLASDDAAGVNGSLIRFSP